jgi:putative ABC transport system substrate-binding protein
MNMMLKNVSIIGALGLGILLAPLSALAQKPGKVTRIGFLSTGGPGQNTEAFRVGLQELNYIVGQNIAIEYRWAAGRDDRLPDLAAELVRMKVDVIVSTSSSAARAAQQATKTIPIVMSVSGDPVGTGLIASLARPGGNITGLTILSPELSGKRLELLKEAFPKVARVAVLWNPASPDKQLDFKETQAVARSLGVQLQSLEVRGAKDFDKVFQAATKERTQALITLSDPVTGSQGRRIMDFAAKSRLPAIYGDSAFVEAGGLMAYGPNISDLYRRAAFFVDKILKGTKPGDLPVQQPIRFELVINLDTAKKIGLSMPPELLTRADKVIKKTESREQEPEISY